MNMGDMYCHLIHMTQGEQGERVDWVGHFGWLESGMTEGFAFEAVMQGGRPVIHGVRRGYPVRLYTRHLSYEPLRHFYWARQRDGAKQFMRSDTRVELPCIAFEDVTDNHLFDDPEFMTIRRQLAVLTPVIRDRRASIDVAFVPEPA